MTFNDIKLGQPFVNDNTVLIKLTGYSAGLLRGRTVPFNGDEQVRPLPPIDKLIRAVQLLTLGTSYIDLARNHGLAREEAREVLAIMEQLKEAGL